MSISLIGNISNSWKFVALASLVSIGTLGYCFRHRFSTTKNQSEVSVYLVMASSEMEANKIADVLLQKRLIACCNIIPNVKSVYTWKGNRESAIEHMLIMKSKTDLRELITATVKQNHSYEVPEVISYPVAGGSKDYLDWVRENTI